MRHLSRNNIKSKAQNRYWFDTMTVSLKSNGYEAFCKPGYSSHTHVNGITDVYISKRTFKNTASYVSAS